MSTLWQKGSLDVDARVQRFCAADDVVADRSLFRHDVRATTAHVNGLQRIGVLTAAERDALVTGLVELDGLFASGAFVLDDRFEDGHTAIEHFLTEKHGDIGRKVHTGRSRNDQVLVAQRLYLKEQLHVLVDVTCAIAERSLARAALGADVVMPGYTHLQRAVPSTVGMFFAGHAEGFLDSAQAARAALDVVDACPLGTGAGYGVNLALDREGVARELGFARVLVSPIAAQNSRGKHELHALAALHAATLDVRRLAWDLSLFFTSEFGFVQLPNAYTTGSSLMPNKRNPDVVELLRTLPSVVEGAVAELQSALSLPSGYQRDLQVTKAPLVRAFSRALDGLALVPALLDAVTFDVDRMRACLSPDMHATDRALELAVAGVPFRDAYKQAAAEIPTYGNRSPDDSVHARVSLGGAAQLGLAILNARLSTLRA